jgi:hypothetical protein
LGSRWLLALECTTTISVQDGARDRNGAAELWLVDDAKARRLGSTRSGKK